jgi:hypothetical protein
MTAADPALQPATPVKRRTPPDGYRRAFEAHRQAAPPSRVDTAIAQAVQRQTAAMRALSRRACPEPEDLPGEAPASAQGPAVAISPPGTPPPHNLQPAVTDPPRRPPAQPPASQWRRRHETRSPDSAEPYRVG